MPIFKLSEKKDTSKDVIAGIRLTESDYVNPNTARIDLKEIRQDKKPGISPNDLRTPENVKQVLEAATQEVPKDIKNKDKIDIPPTPPSPEIPSNSNDEIVLPPINKKPTPLSTLKPPIPTLPTPPPPVTEDKKEEKPEEKPPEEKEKLNISEPKKQPSGKISQTSPASTLTLKAPTMDGGKPVFDNEPETQVSALPDEVLNKFSEDKETPEDRKDSVTTIKPPEEAEKLKLPTLEKPSEMSIKNNADDKGMLALPKKDDAVSGLKKLATDDTSELKLPPIGEKPTPSSDAPPLKPLLPKTPTIPPPASEDKEAIKLPTSVETPTPPSNIPPLKPPTPEIPTLTPLGEENKVKLPDDDKQSSEKEDKPETDEEKKDDDKPLKKKFPMGKKPMGKMPFGKKPLSAFGKKPLGKKPLGAFGKKPLGKKPLGSFGKKPLSALGEKPLNAPSSNDKNKTPLPETPIAKLPAPEEKDEIKSQTPEKKPIPSLNIPTLKPPTPEVPTLKPPTPGTPTLKPPVLGQPTTGGIPTLKPAASSDAQTMILPAVGAKPPEKKETPSLDATPQEKDKALELSADDNLQVPTAKIPAYERADKTAVTPKVPTRNQSASLYCFFKIARAWQKKHYLSTDHGVRIGGSNSLNEITLNDDDLDALQVVIIEVGDKWVAMDTGPKDMMRVDGTASRQVTLSPNLPFVLQIGSESVVVLLSDTGEAPELIPAVKKPDAAPGAIQLSKVKCGEKEFPIHIPETLPAGESKEITGLDKTGFTLTPINDPERILQALKIPITGGSLYVGRSSKTSDLLVPDKNVSRQHAKVTIQEKALLIEDCDTSNGTFLNSEEISDPTLVHAGEIITFGSNPFMVSFQ